MENLFFLNKAGFYGLTPDSYRNESILVIKEMLDIAEDFEKKQNHQLKTMQGGQ